MSIALVIVHKTLGGHKWSNTHAFRIGIDAAGAPSDADLSAAGAGTTLTDVNTSTSPTNIIQAIVAFERFMHQPDVLFTDVLVTDGKRNTGTTPSTQYAALSGPNVNGALSAGTAAGATLEPGAISLLVHRNVVGFGHKPGRMFLRGALLESDVAVGGPRMIQWTSATPTGNWTAYLATAQAKLAPYLFGGSGTDAQGKYLLPIFMTPKQHLTNPTIPVGQLINGRDVSGFTIVGPAVRQTQRGKKKKKV